jgi:hypothetical protein
MDKQAPAAVQQEDYQPLPPAGRRCSLGIDKLIEAAVASYKIG